MSDPQAPVPIFHDSLGGALIASLGKTLADYTSKGFLVRDGSGFKAAGAKVRVEET